MVTQGADPEVKGLCSEKQRKGPAGPLGAALFATGWAELGAGGQGGGLFSCLFVQQAGFQFPSQESQGSNPNPNPTPPSWQGKSQELSFEARNDFHPLIPHTQQANPIPAGTFQRAPCCILSNTSSYKTSHSTESAFIQPREARGGPEREEGRSEREKRQGSCQLVFHFEWLFHAHPWGKNLCLVPSLLERSPFTALTK